MSCEVTLRDECTAAHAATLRLPKPVTHRSVRFASGNAQMSAGGKAIVRRLARWVPVSAAVDCIGYTASADGGPTTGAAYGRRR